MNFKFKTVDDLFQYVHFNKIWEVIKFSIESGMFDRIGDHGIRIVDLAKSMGCDGKKLHHIICILLFLGFIEKRDEFVYNSPLVDRYLTDKTKMNISDLLIYNSKTSFSARNFSKVLGLKVKQEICDDKLYMSAMDLGSSYAALLVGAKVLKNAEGQLLDLGCGSGIFSIKACQLNENLCSVCVDNAAVLSVLEEKLKDHQNLRRRITLIEADALTVKFEPSSFNYILLSNFLHFFNKNCIIKLIKKSHVWLNDRGRVIINDIFTDIGIYGALFALEWLSNGVDFISLTEMQNILQHCKFNDAKVLRDDKIHTEIILAQKR